jgi:poly-beta-1,6-N-acetyl-D-glucosamine N-deacetylase
MMRKRRALFYAVVAAGLQAFSSWSALPVRAETTAVVFAYGRVGEDSSPSTSLRIDQFEAHLEELTDDLYTVLPLPDVVRALRAGASLPDRAVALTVDDASRSFYDNAWPRLKDAGLPVTLFVSTDAIDRGDPAHMTWNEIREVASAPGVTIGGLGASTLSLASRPIAEARADLMRMEDRLKAELGRKPALFAYPQGEFSAEVRALVAERGYDAAFGLQSGAVSAGADRLALPRFIMTESFGSVERFRLAANALPLPVSDVTPEDMVVTVNPPPIGFTVDPSVGDLGKLACFASSQGRTQVEHIAEDRVEIRLSAPFPPGRTRINCTLPAADGRWRWYGQQFVVPE